MILDEAHLNIKMQDWAGGPAPCWPARACLAALPGSSYRKGHNDREPNARITSEDNEIVYPLATMSDSNSTMDKGAVVIAKRGFQIVRYKHHGRAFVNSSSFVACWKQSV